MTLTLTDGGNYLTTNVWTTGLSSLDWGHAGTLIINGGASFSTGGTYAITYTDDTGGDPGVAQPLTKCPRCRIIHYSSHIVCAGWDRYSVTSAYLGDVLKSKLGIDPEWAQLVMEESLRLGHLRDAGGQKGKGRGERVHFDGEKPRWEVESQDLDYWWLWIEKVFPCL